LEDASAWLPHAREQDTHDHTKPGGRDRTDAMTALNVWTYPTVEGARRLEQRLSDGAVGDVVVMDGSLVTWLPGRTTPQVRELQGVARTRGLGVGFWGLLFGIVVVGPDLETLVGEPQSGLDGALAGVGIDRTVLADLRTGLRPGCSAVAAICDDIVAAEIERVSGPVSGSFSRREDALAQSLRALFTADQEDALRRVFSA
jgi:uncharacterized membrane protein